MLRFRWPLAVVSLSFASCTGSVTFRSPVDWTMDVGAYYGSNFHNVQDLVSNEVIASIACPGPGTAGDAACQMKVPASGAGSDIVLRCNESSVCDPEPYRFIEDLGVQDLSALSEPHLAVVDKVELREVELTIHTNSTNVALPAFQVRWGATSATSGTAMTTTYVLGEVPEIAAGETGEIVVTLDHDEFDRLDAYIRATSSEVRFFLATTYDAEPTVGIPMGEVDVTVGLIIKASGDLR